MEDRNTIQNRMLESIDSRFDKTVGSFFYDALKPVAIELENMNSEIAVVESKLDIESLSGVELEKTIYQRAGIERKTATKATTFVTIVGGEGATISIGDLMASDAVSFVSVEDKVIGSSGEIKVLVECEEYGTKGNVPTGAIKYFPVSISGLVSVTNDDAITNGYEAETDEELLKRYQEKIRTPITSGNIYHYNNWAKEVTGVGDARVAPLWDGDNTVKITIIDSNKLPAGQDLITRVQEYIDPNSSGLGEGQAPIGAFCTVMSASSKKIDIEATISKDNNFSIEQLKNSITDGVVEYLEGIAFQSDLVSYAHIGSIILGTEGVLDYRDLRVNTGIENIKIENEEVAVIGEVVLNE